MANDKENYKEGVDFKMVDKGGYKTRHFFTRAEKDAMKAPKAAPVAKATPKAKAKPTPMATPKPKAAAKAAVGANVGVRKSTGAKVTGEQQMPVPGAAIGRAIRNAFTGKGETDAAKISASGAGTMKFTAPQKAKTPIRVGAKRYMNAGGQYATVGYAKGGMTKKKAC